MSEDKGLRKNEGKNRVDLFPSDVLWNVGEVLTQGAEKYDVRNWENGMAWSKVMASLERHLARFKSGLDIDPESGLHHIDHVLCNAAFLSRYARSHPEKDDRFLPYIQNHKRIGLDIDGVLCDFMGAALKRLGIEDCGNAAWYSSYKFKDSSFWEELNQDKDFWLNLEPLVNPDDMKFEPIAYVTARGIPKEWTEEWLERNGFPCNDVHVVGTEDGNHKSKVQVLKDLKCDIFIDDHYRHFVDLNQNGIKCYLMDTYYNSRYPVGNLRINDLNEVLTYLIKE